MNGLRNAPPFLIERVAKGEGIVAQFHRIRDIGGMGFPVASAKTNKGAADPEAGCPFAPGVAERTRQGVEETVAAVTAQPADEAWCLTVDEIGAVFDRAPEGKSHVATCPRCAEGFQPADFGQADWSGVKPVDIYAKDFKVDPNDRAANLRAYHTAMFVNYATARLFTPLRDRLGQLNEEKRQNPAAVGRPWVYAYALRGNTFLMGGHSLDFFDFYRYADNGMVYETSNRDARVWQWDSYLCDVGRAVSAERGLKFGVYVKPYRGAPVQRALSAASRGATMLYWYTYGPDWAKGDTFAADDASLALASKAARLLAESEHVLYGAAWDRPAEVAVVTPRSSEIWMRLTGSPPDRVAAWENAKWTYTALAHSHISVDAIDEGILAEKSVEYLGRYKVLYVSGPNLTRAAAENVAKWVEAGGTLYTSAGGLRFDEANQPLAAIEPVLGLKSRNGPEMWKRVQLYGATALESWGEPARQVAPVPDGAAVSGLPGAADRKPVVGREVLTPADGTEMLARFADKSAAVTRHRHGKGSAYAVGLLPGLEYSGGLRGTGYDMTRDFDDAWRTFVSVACKDRVAPVVDVSRPTVEAVLLKNNLNDPSSRRAIAVMNWAYRTAPDSGNRRARVELVPATDLKLTVQGPAPARPARSAATGLALPVRPEVGRRVCHSAAAGRGRRCAGG